MRLLTLALILSASAATAQQDWPTRDTDTLFTREGLRDRLVGQSITFYDDGVSQFAEDGVYAYTYDQGGTAFGEYVIGEDSTVCVNFQNGFTRCDLFVAAGDQLVLITEKGDRYPVRP
ncbi:hypothetical protein [Aliiroseovarius sp. YM-037]|uniref:hypothetical protein n=1 Tax=Aliiroseovarius sp. YM-037 TaxID=3341728 RepID=UPI003A80F7EC